MTKLLKVLVLVGTTLILACLSPRPPAETAACRTCDDAVSVPARAVQIEYRDGTARSTCSLRCLGAMLGAYRAKDVRTIWVREYGSGDRLDAKKAFWVLRPGHLPGEAFAGRSAADALAASQGGRVVDYRNMMAALFSGMYDEIHKVKLMTGPREGDDIAAHPQCVYCGMDRKHYAHSRVLLRYRDGSEAGLCSLHCAGIDLALHPEKVPAQIMVGTFDRKNLLDAEQAVWVLGGSKQGVMSIRGKWAFRDASDARAFIDSFGGAISDFRLVMIAAFEDMWEIIR